MLTSIFLILPDGTEAYKARTFYLHPNVTEVGSDPSLSQRGQLRVNTLGFNLQLRYLTQCAVSGVHGNRLDTLYILLL